MFTHRTRHDDPLHEMLDNAGGFFLVATRDDTGPDLGRRLDELVDDAMRADTSDHKGNAAIVARLSELGEDALEELFDAREQV